MGVANIKSFGVGDRIKFTYKNWKGVTAERRMLFMCIEYGPTEWHSETNQWFITGVDLDKHVRRSYCIPDIDIDTMERF